MATALVVLAGCHVVINLKIGKPQLGCGHGLRWALLCFGFWVARCGMHVSSLRLRGSSLETGQVSSTSSSSTKTKVSVRVPMRRRDGF